MSSDDSLQINLEDFPEEEDSYETRIRMKAEDLHFEPIGKPLFQVNTVKPESVKFQIVSDIHLNVKRRMYKIEPVADYLLVCGDIELYLMGFYHIKRFLKYHAKLFKKVIWVAGNHEMMVFGLTTVDGITQKCKKIARKTGTIFLQNDSYEVEPGFVVIGSTLFSYLPPPGAGANPNSPGWLKPYSRFIHVKTKSVAQPVSVGTLNELHFVAKDAIERELLKCREKEQTVVVITHYGPLAPFDTKHERDQLLTNNVFNKYYSSDDDMESVLKAGKGVIGLWAFGHDHENSSFTYRYGDGEHFDVVSNQLGNTAEPYVAQQFNPRFAYEVKAIKPEPESSSDEK